MKKILLIILAHYSLFSHAQENQKPVIPEKVMKLFDNYVGAWTVKGTMGDQSFKGRACETERNSSLGVAQHRKAAPLARM